MYKSIIDIIHTDMEIKMEGEIMKAVQRCGIHVDKEELLKALQYDRGQYDKGYEDGLNADKWIPCEERLPECEWGCETKALMFQIKNSDYIEVGCYGEGGEYRDRYFRTYTDTLEGYEASDVIAWQPLPAPYKKEGAGNE
jgi:hypothetical protein